MSSIPCILSIAGSDSGGGAGIQADLKAISMMGGYGATVITALTAQNTHAVTGIHAPSASFVVQQFRTVLEDITISAAKTGMLFSASIIEAIAPLLSQKKYPLVVDPVCVATSGAQLLKDDAVDAMVKMIFPYADVLTPNIPETELFTGVKINDREDVFQAAKILLSMGPKAVLIKGGHSDSWAITDWFVRQGEEPIPFIQQRVDTRCTHGTGCTLSAAIATGLGQGMELGAAIKRAQEYLNLALRGGSPIGEGGGPPLHLAPWIQAQERPRILDALDNFGDHLRPLEGLDRLLPLGGSNVVQATSMAGGLDDIAGFSGGIVKVRNKDVVICGSPQFGVTERLGATLIGVRRINSEMRCAMTIALNSKIKRAIKSSGLEVVWVDRGRKPDYVKSDHGAIEEWGAFESLKMHEDPKIVHGVADPGAFGVEPVIRLVAKDLTGLRSSLELILKQLDKLVS